MSIKETVTEPLISVIIPIFGVEKYIERCARSLFEQSYCNIEYIFINDCTKDNSICILLKIIDDYPERKAKIHILNNETNKGLAYSRKRGYLFAKGEYLSSCDGDDWVAKDMYEVMLKIALNEGSDIVITDMVSHDGEKPLGNILCKCRSLKYLLEDTLLGDVSACIPACLFKSKLLDDNISYPEADMAEDMVLSIQLILKSEKISYSERPLYFYRFNNQSISRTSRLYIVLMRTVEFKENVIQMINILNRYKLSEKFREEIVYLKHRVKSYIWPYLYNYRAYVLWRRTFPELLIDVMPHSRITFRTKLLYILTQIGVYPLYKKFSTHKYQDR